MLSFKKLYESDSLVETQHEGHHVLAVVALVVDEHVARYLQRAIKPARPGPGKESYGALRAVADGGDIKLRQSERLILQDSVVIML